jgi:hypothetical protein
MEALTIVLVCSVILEHKRSLDTAFLSRMCFVLIARYRKSILMDLQDWRTVLLYYS